METVSTVTESPAPGLPAPENLQRPEPSLPRDYGTLNAVYVALLAALVAAARRMPPERTVITAPELIPIGAASFSLSKTIAREKIGTWVREPFVEESGGRRRPRGRRLRHAVGELVTCTRCVGAWSALGLVGLRVTSPSAGRIVTAVLATAAVNDFLHAGFRLLCDEANQSGVPERTGT